MPPPTTPELMPTDYTVTTHCSPVEPFPCRPITVVSGLDTQRQPEARCPMRSWWPQECPVMAESWSRRAANVQNDRNLFSTTSLNEYCHSCPWQFINFVVKVRWCTLWDQNWHGSDSLLVNARWCTLWDQDWHGSDSFLMNARWCTPRDLDWHGQGSMIVNVRWCTFYGVKIITDRVHAP